MRYLQRSIGVAIAALALLALSWASTAPLAGATSDAILRVSLGARPERIETCRTVSDEELAKVAPQMRLRTVCEGTTARYRLDVRRDGAPLVSQVVRGGGLRHDRQLYISRDIPGPAGEGVFDIQLTRIDTVSARDDDENDRGDRAEDREGPDSRERREVRERDERQRRREEAVPAELRLQVQARLAPREVLLVTYEAEERRLASRRAP